jgi:hypothetical protein
MEIDRKYLVAVALLAVLAVAFGILGTIAPPLAGESAPIQPQQKSSPDSIGHFQNPPTYDSGWVNITAKAGQYITLKPNLNTTNVIVDITGKQSLDANGGALAWSKTYGGTNADYASSVVQTNDGGYAIAGYTSSYGSGKKDFFLVKTRADGTLEWNKTYGGTNDDYANSLVQTNDGGYALLGFTNSFGAGNGDFWLVKTNSAGTMLWNKTYGGTNSDYAYSLVQTADGGYALAGSTYSYGAGSPNGWLVKTDSAGNKQWNKTYGGASYDEARSLVQTGDGGYALAGDTNSFGGGYDFWLVKTDSDGLSQWNKTYGGKNSDSAWTVVQTDDGGYALAGSTSSYGAGSNDFWLVKTDWAGNAQWNKTYGGTNSDLGTSLVQTADGGYALAGSTYSFGAGYFDFWLVRTDAGGTLLWNRTCGGANFDLGPSLVQTADGGYALAGSTSSYGSGNYDAWLIKINPEMNREHQRNLGGTILIPGWSQTYGGTGNDIPHSVIQTSDGGFAIAGYSNSFGGTDDMWLIKTDSVGTLLWSKTYGGTGGDSAVCVIQTSDKGFAMAGATSSYGASGYNFWLVKTDPAGNSQWNKTYGGSGNEGALSIVQTNDGGYALAGSTSSYGSGRDDFFLVKTRPDGTLEWNKTYGGKEEDSCYSVVQTFDGGYALGGCTNSSGAGLTDMWLVKTNSTGFAVWNKTYGGPKNEVAYAMIQANDGGYVLAGANSIGDFLVVKFNSAGTLEWSKTYGGPGIEVAHSLVQASDGGYAIAGSTNPILTDPNGADFWLVKTDPLGKMQWSQSYGTLVNDVAQSVVQTRDGGYALAGQTVLWTTGPLKSDFLLVKTDAEIGLKLTALTDKTITLYRCKTDLDWNYVHVRMWLVKEPSWIYGDVNMDGKVDIQDLYILSRNYGKTFSLLSLSGVVGIASVHTVKARKKKHN